MTVPSRPPIEELGELVGYPRCCVEAFAAQADRSNNSLNRYYSWSRTVSNGRRSENPWPWQLNNLYTVIAPFYPCSYCCEAALAWSTAALEQMAGRHPESVEGLREVLARPVLYFDHEHQVILDGRLADGAVSYRGAGLPGPGSPELRRFAAAIAAGDRLRLDDASLVVERDGEVVLELERTDPALGFVAPFG